MASVNPISGEPHGEGPADLSSPAAMRAYILERLTGDTGEPDAVLDAAHGLSVALAVAFRTSFENRFGVAAEIEPGDCLIARLAHARPSDAGATMLVASVAQSTEHAVLALDAEALGLLVALLFGADPTKPAVPLTREPTAIELDVAGLLFETLADALDASGAAFQLARPLGLPLCGTPMAREALRDGPAVRLVFQFGSGGSVALFLPQRLVLKRPDAQGGAEADWGSRIEEELMRSSITLEATMPLGRLTLGAVAEFAPGVVVPIDALGPSSAKISARGKALFSCEFGRLGDNYTLRVNEPFSDAQDFLETLVAPPAASPFPFA